MLTAFYVDVRSLDHGGKMATHQVGARCGKEKRLPGWINGLNKGETKMKKEYKVTVQRAKTTLSDLKLLEKQSRTGDRIITKSDLWLLIFDLREDVIGLLYLVTGEEG
jgi:hypothetical protein